MPAGWTSVTAPRALLLFRDWVYGRDVAAGTFIEGDVLRRHHRTTRLTERPLIERASQNDLAMLAMDRGRVPEQVGAILMLDARPGFDVAALQDLLAERIRAVPRLGQRLLSTPPGCGRPVWVADETFDVARQMRHVRCPKPGDERALFQLAVEVVATRLPRSQPMWSMVFVSGLADGRVALVVVLHHVVADGIGGLAVLDRLVDSGLAVSTLPIPQRPPTTAQLAADAMRGRLQAFLRIPRALRGGRASLAAAGGLHPDRAADCSLLQATGSQRRIAVARGDLRGLRAAAHGCGGTVNDAILTAIAGALRALLLHRGESVDGFAVMIPVAARQRTPAADLGNHVSPLTVHLPAAADTWQRLSEIAAVMHAARSSVRSSRSVAPLWPLFRIAARLGLFHRYLNRQRRCHTLVSSLHGPEQRITVGGAPVSDIIPLAVADAGNVSVSFDVLSYAGTVTVTSIADPTCVPDLDLLVEALRVELTKLSSGRPSASRTSLVQSGRRKDAQHVS